MISTILPAFISPKTPAPILGTKSQLYALAIALLTYREDYGVYPEGNTQDIIKLLHPKTMEFKNHKWNMYLDFEESNKKIFDSNGNYLDAWGKPIQIIIQDDSVISYSFGKNKIDNHMTLDDIVCINGKIKDDTAAPPTNLR